MSQSDQEVQIIIFDTTLRDGELALTQEFTLSQKLQLALMLEAAGVDVIEVGYPGAFRKDLDDLLRVGRQVQQSMICGLASSQPEEIEAVAAALKPAARGRINVFTPIRAVSEADESEAIAAIQQGVSLARRYCEDVEWSAFDATRCPSDLVCRAVETAIRSGASTITIPDSMGVATPSTFVALIEAVRHRVPTIDQVTLSIHCHDDRGLAVENSLAALAVGVRQVECSVNGLGARAGNANLTDIVTAIAHHPKFQTGVQAAHLPALSEQVAALKQSPPPES
jgi:2-isopropylmalate synthase